MQFCRGNSSRDLYKYNIIHMNYDTVFFAIGSVLDTLRWGNLISSATNWCHHGNNIHLAITSRWPFWGMVKQWAFQGLNKRVFFIPFIWWNIGPIQEVHFSGNSAGDLFLGWFKGFWWPSTRGQKKSRIESPGKQFYHLKLHSLSTLGFIFVGGRTSQKSGRDHGSDVGNTSCTFIHPYSNDLGLCFTISESSFNRNISTITLSKLVKTKFELHYFTKFIHTS